MAVRVREFAGGWAAFTLDVPEAGLLANGIGTPPGDLDLRTVDPAGQHGYGVDLAAPLPVAPPGVRERDWASTGLRNPNHDGPHADHLALLSQGR
ncbi:hypothetical protein CFN78_12845 [Amycolatopsis antarctica]|uniref:Uncharacterized protein n=1 Tax=Amycolatopsis antarctica TaxID=1854586 RepID=A0A263D256_9PSEU|nr:hypothetical protein [Amycolatopsis antarctica]OZM72533.1 hypothetical protein CFN78_12845 [Amycolatopsis antarctica]